MDNTTLGAPINAASSGDNTIIAGVASNQLHTMKLFLVANGAVNIQFWDGPSATGTALTGVINLASGATFVLDMDGEPWFSTSRGNGLILNLSGAVQISGHLRYLSE